MVVAVVAEVALVLAHLRRYSLPAAGLISGGVLLSLGLASWRIWRPRVTLAPARLVTLAGITGICVLLFTPGFPAAMAGWDPGVYLNHGLSIARTGAYDLRDPVVGHDPALPAVPGRFPGTDESEVQSGRSIVGFYHLYPALLAPAASVAGERGVVNVNPILGVLTVLAIALVTWRVFGPLAGGLAGVLSAVNMLQVWHSRYPTSEVLTQLLVVGATLGVVLAVQMRSRAPAAVAGVLTGLVFLTRADGLLVVLLAAMCLVILATFGRFDRRCAWFTIGLAATLPHALLQAAVFAGSYTSGQGLPSVPVLMGFFAALVGIGGVVALMRRTRARRLTEQISTWLASPRGRRVAGGLIVGTWTVVLVANYLRPVFDPAALTAGTNPDAAQGYYDARSLLRLTWFLTPLGVAALWLGVAVLAFRPWRFSAWVMVVPTLVLLPVYFVDPRISDRLIWWTRRFVPYTLTGMMILMAVALAAGLAYRGRARLVVRLVAGVATVVLVGSYARMSWPLRGHDELDGSFAISRQIAAVSEGEPAVYLWSLAPGPAEGPANAFGSTVQFRNGAISAQIADDAGMSDVNAFAEAFPDRELFLVVNGTDLPPSLDDEEFVNVTHLNRALPLWELTYDRRPERPSQMIFDLTVWQLVRN